MTSRGKTATRVATVEPTHFLNVDLEVEGRATEIDAMVAELDRRLVLIHMRATRGRRRVHYELLPSASTVDQTLRRLLTVLERLAPGARRGWRAARVRDFNVGMQAGRLPHSSEHTIATATLDRIATLGGRLVFTVYAPFPRPRR